ncbi:MAG: hypothetical protein HRT61_24155 [Ekhidna sp.]|nr:hypothetical protein [Ekhidna sp.]
MRKKKRPPAPYKCIVKVGAEDFKAWHVRNLVSFTNFLDREHPTWRFFNVYCKKNRTQLASFTKNNRPTTFKL